MAFKTVSVTRCRHDRDGGPAQSADVGARQEVGSRDPRRPAEVPGDARRVAAAGWGASTRSLGRSLPRHHREPLRTDRPVVPAPILSRSTKRSSAPCTRARPTRVRDGQNAMFYEPAHRDLGSAPQPVHRVLRSASDRLDLDRRAATASTTSRRSPVPERHLRTADGALLGLRLATQNTVTALWTPRVSSGTWRPTTLRGRWPGPRRPSRPTSTSSRPSASRRCRRTFVAPRRVAESPVHFECGVLQSIDIESSIPEGRA